MTTLDNNYDALAWGSHLPALLAAVASSSGPVLEIGIGHFSTPALRALCLPLHRKLVSVEDNSEWFNEFRNYEHDLHRLINADYDNVLPILAKEHWGAVFIDNSPGGEGRKKDFMLFILNSDYVVVHDYHAENEEAIGPLLSKLDYRIYRKYQPPTLIASASKRIPDSL
jgi:hypothetical protein